MKVPTVKKKSSNAVVHWKKKVATMCGLLYKIQHKSKRSALLLKIDLSVWVACEQALCLEKKIPCSTKGLFTGYSVRSHETPRTESDKHCDQNKANVWAGAAVVILKAKILVNSSVYRFRNKRNGRHQTLLLGWVQNRLKISRKMAGITKRVGEIGAESIHTFPETGERPRKVQALVSGMFTGILYGEKR